MSSRTVKSPTGTDIEIVTDDDWCATAGVALKAIAMWARSKPLVIRELWEHGPSIDSNGGATGVLFERIREHYPNSVYELSAPGAVNALMTEPANAAAFQRTINGKRCYGLELIALPETYYQKLRWDIGGSMSSFTATPVTSNGTKPEPIEATEPFHDAILDNPNIILPIETLEIAERLPEVYGPSVEVEIAGQVAMELLTRVVEIISAGSASGMTDAKLRQLQTEYETVTNRLGQRLEENDRMRKQLRQTGEELAAVKLERDGLRQRLRQTEANLNSALKGESAHAVTTEVMKRVDRIMRETPRPNPREET
jgi:regulator of replication initiation timing